MLRFILISCLLTGMATPYLFGQCNDPVASFSILGNLTSICEGETIVCDNRCDETNPVACVSYMVWDWGDGQRDTVMNFNDRSHVYTYSDNLVCNGSIPINGKLYPIRLYVIYTNGTDHYNESPVRVRPKPRAGFSVKDTLCEDNLVINPIDFSCAAETFSWTVKTQPGGTVIGTSTLENPSFTVPGVGTYLVTQMVSNTFCGSDMISKQVVVVPAVVPMGALMPAQLCAPDTVMLSSAGTLHANSVTWGISPGSGWMFATGSTKNSPNPKVIFTLPGNYTVMLSATGCNTAQITVGTVMVRASPTATMTGVQGGCLGANGFNIDPNLSGIQNGGFPNLTYEWAFPGGTPATFSGQNPPTVNYPNAGTYTVTCIITGDANDPCGVRTITQMLNVSQPANASATVSAIPAGACAPFTLTLTNTSTNVDTFLWTVIGPASGWHFTGGTTATSDNPQIEFTESGSYRIRLTLPAFISCFTSNSWESPDIVVHSAPSLELAPLGAQCVPTTVNFTLLMFQNGNEPATTVNWTFPGGTPATFVGQTPPPISFTNAGLIQVIAQTQGNLCGQSADTLNLNLTSKEQVALNPYPDTVCHNGMPVQLQTTLTGTPGWPANAPGGLFNPATAPAGPNTIVVTNGSTDPGCATDTFATIFVVDETLTLTCVPDFCDTSGIATLSGFSPVSNNVFSGPGVIDPLLGTISAAVAGFGSHTVTMTHTEQGFGCVFTQTCDYNVFQLPQSGITGAPAQGCVNTPISFQFPGATTGLSLEWRIDGGPVQSTLPNPDLTFPQTGDFTVWLVVKNANCSDTAYHMIHIAAPLQLSLQIDPDTVCAELPVQVTATVIGENPQWTLQVGNFQTLPGFTTGSISFPSGVNDTVYTLTLSGSNVCPQNDKTATIYVRALPVAHLYADTDTICSGDTIRYQNLSSGLPLSSLTLDLGNGKPLVGAPFPWVQYFADTGLVYINAVLYVKNTCAEDYDTARVTVYPVDIEAFNQINKDKLCEGEALYIHNYSKPFEAPVYYTFGDGSSTHDPNPVKVYADEGVYKLVQYAWAECGGYDSLVRWITIIKGPPADFNWLPDTICAGAAARFRFTGAADTIGYSFLWITDAGDTTAGAAPNLSWTTPGWHSATLVVTDLNSGCYKTITQTVHIRSNPAPGITAGPFSNCGKLTTTLNVTGVPPGYFYEWTLSNGFTAVGAPLTYTFEEAGLWGATVRVTDPWQCSGTADIDSLWVKPLPGSAFAMSAPYHCGAPATLSLTNNTTDALGTAWYLNGQYLSNHTDTAFTLTQPGVYSIQLVSENTWHCFDTATQVYKIYVPPIAKAIADSSGCDRKPVQFTNLSEHSDGYWWFFGDGDTSSLEEPAHLYADPGLYQVSLIATIEGVCPDTFQFPAPIVIKPAPVAGFTVQDSIHGRGLIVVHDQSMGANAWLYQFGDAFTSNEQNPVATLTSTWDTLIIQTVTNADGCTDADTVVFHPKNFKTLVVPNALMPDAGAGEFTRFIPKGAGLKSYKLDIFSEWGELIWSSDKLINGVPAESWDGNDASGRPLQQGAYLWKIKAVFEDGDEWQGMPAKGRDGGRLQPFGTVTVIR
jgi:PKD repeat protein